MGKLSKKSLSESFTFEAKTRIKFDGVMKKKLKSQVLIFFSTLLISALSLFNFIFYFAKRGFAK